MGNVNVNIVVLDLGETPNNIDIQAYIKSYFCSEGGIQILSCVVTRTCIEVEFVHRLMLGWCYGATKYKIEIDKVAYGMYMKLRKSCELKEKVHLTESESDEIFRSK